VGTGTSKALATHVYCSSFFSLLSNRPAALAQPLRDMDEHARLTSFNDIREEELRQDHAKTSDEVSRKHDETHTSSIHSTNNVPKVTDYWMTLALVLGFLFIGTDN
jgi:hypothetical protein